MLRTNAVVAIVPVGANPYGVAITPFLDNDSQFLNSTAAIHSQTIRRFNGNVSASNFVGNGVLGLNGLRIKVRAVQEIAVSI